MKSNRISLLLAVVVGVLLSFAFVARQSGTFAADGGVRRWEHMALSVDAAQGVGDADTSRQIVQLGNDGWELVDVESFTKAGTTTKLVYCFKRPK